MQRTDSLLQPANGRLVTPSELKTQLQLPENSVTAIKNARAEAIKIIQQHDERLLVIIGPCSIHDPTSVLEYAEKLIVAKKKYENDLHIVMRTYFEKPRTTIGWKGLINDPFLDNSFDINHGLLIARKLLIELNDKQLPTATEFVDPMIHYYLSDLITWGSIGARTVESQIHRELASSLTIPVGFKNNTDGNIKVAIDALKTAKLAHTFTTINEDGVLSIQNTKGNENCHIILRGGNHAPNFSQEHIHEAAINLKKSGLKPSVMVDCSHGNSMKNYNHQRIVADDIARQLKQGSTWIHGIMLESYLMAGHQPMSSTKQLVYGQSITDGCINWEDSLSILEKLAFANHCRRLKLQPPTPIAENIAVVGPGP